ncbi:MAG TPA: DUF1461 domain-containing protein [Candidatus Nanoarchaeia archaeon]|nr:DUF1461 domain-containing protein [Candidatus Nanoarchaeia archaeon]
MRIISVVLLVLLCFLLSYHLTIATLSLAPEPQEVFDFLYSDHLLGGFTPSEISHLYDVKKVMNGTAAVFFVVVLLTVSVVLHNFDKKAFLLAGLTVFSIVFLLLLLAFFHFNQLFASFHSIFFAQGTWIFPSDSKLIQLFPLSFFITLTKRILIGTFLSSLILLGLYRISK